MFPFMCSGWVMGLYGRVGRYLPPLYSLVVAALSIIIVLLKVFNTQHLRHPAQTDSVLFRKSSIVIDVIADAPGLFADRKI